MTRAEIDRLTIGGVLSLAEKYGRRTEHARAMGNWGHAQRLYREAGWCIEALKRKSQPSAVNRNLQSWWTQLSCGEEAYKRTRR